MNNEAKGYLKLKSVTVVDRAGLLPILTHKSVGGWSYYLLHSPCSLYELPLFHHISYSACPGLPICLNTNYIIGMEDMAIMYEAGILVWYRQA